MTSSPNDKPQQLFDTRVVERNIAAGIITKEDQQAFLDGLGDCAEMCEETSTRFVRHIDDDDA